MRRPSGVRRGSAAFTISSQENDPSRIPFHPQRQVGAAPFWFERVRVSIKPDPSLSTTTIAQKKERGQQSPTALPIFPFLFSSFRLTYCAPFDAIDAPATTISTRRFNCLPAAVSFVATGLSLPNPCAEIVSCCTPCATR
jgi:hypothetical protein